MSSAKPTWIIGYTTRNHLIIDLDNTSLFKVLYLVKLLMENFAEIGNCLVLESSRSHFQEWMVYRPLQNVKVCSQRHNYHVVFGNLTDYEYCCYIIETLAELDAINKDYVNIRYMRQDMTLRVSPVVMVKGVKDKPKVCMFILNKGYNGDNKGILSYMSLYKLSC